MLIEISYKVGDVVTLKLLSGEEVVARLDADDGNSVTLDRPLSMAVTQQGIGLGPFLFTGGSEVKAKIDMSKVVVIVKTDEAMAKQYLSSTTGIAV